MVRIDTGTNVTLMKNVHSVRNGSVMQFITYAVGSLWHFAHLELPVSVMKERCSPEPTPAIGFRLNLAQKPLNHAVSTYLAIEIVFRRVTAPPA